MTMLKSNLLAVALLVPVHAVVAQQVPDAGQQIQQIPQPPIVEKPAPDIRINRDTPAVDSAPVGPRVRVNSIQITGETLSVSYTHLTLPTKRIV